MYFPRKTNYERHRNYTITQLEFQLPTTKCFVLAKKGKKRELRANYRVVKRIRTNLLHI